MMGLAIDPPFATNRYIYTCFASTLGGANGDVRLVRWTVDANFTALTNRTDIVTGAPVNATGSSGATPAAARASTRRAACGWAPATPPRASVPQSPTLARRQGAQDQP